MKYFDHHSGQYFTIDQAKIYYEATGNKNGPVLLLLHGGFGNIEDLNPILPEVYEKFHVIGIDSRGQGKSTLGSEKLTYERIQLDIEALLQSLNIHNVSIIGFSDGGIVAYRLACFSSLQIDKLVAIGSTWHINDIMLVEDIYLRITAESWKAKFPETYTAYQRLNPEANFNLLTTSLKDMWLDKGPSGHPNEHITRLKCPALIVRGDQDHLFSRKSAVELADLLEEASLLNIPFAGHVAYEDQPDIFNMSLRQFLSGKH